MRPGQISDDGLYVGLMSGTSLDGIDAALVRFGGRGPIPSAARLEAFATTPFAPELADRLRRAVAGDADVAELCDLDFALGEALAEAVAAVVEGADDRVVAVGSHGQTVHHRPPARGASGSGAAYRAPTPAGAAYRAPTPAGAADGPSRSSSRGSTLQVGEPAVIAERTGLDVIADFRVRDVAAGGHGAPLAPLFDDMLLRGDEGTRAIQNIGGMGNVTALPARGDGNRRPMAFDTGPGVAMIDAAVRRRTDGRQQWDEDGRLAAAGSVDEDLVAAWLDDPFFAEPPPRSTGRERFGARRVHDWLEANGQLSLEDAVATLTEVTARSIARSYDLLEFPIDDVYLSGGGARNREIGRRLAARLPRARIHPLDDLGWSADAREAAAFALLARQHVLDLPVDLSWATGAPGPRRLGKRVPA